MLTLVRTTSLDDLGEVSNNLFENQVMLEYGFRSLEPYKALM